MAEKPPSGYREHIQTAAAVIGVVTALLYVFGYVAERVHWNLYGHIEVPTDHIEFLYRGGNVVLSCLAAWVLYLAEPKSLMRWCLLIAFAVTMLAGRREAARRGRERRANLSLYAGLFILLALSLHDLTDLPEPKANLLFDPNAGCGAAASEGYSGSYIGLLGLWLILFLQSGWVMRRTADEADGSAVRDWAMGAPPEAGTPTPAGVVERRARWSIKAAATKLGELLGRPPSLVRRVSTTAAALMLVLLPIVYGLFKYPNVYPFVSVVPAKDMTDDSKQSLARAGALALLFTTDDNYVLYARRPEAVVLQLKKSEVSIIKVLKLADVTNACSFRDELAPGPSTAASPTTVRTEAPAPTR
jgi:hypothetical protein